MTYKQWTLSITVTAIALVLATLALHAVITPTTSLIQPVQELSAPEGKIRAVLGILVACESSGDVNAVHFNDGAIGLHSRGLLQFQRPTFEGYWKGLINKDVEEQEIDNLWTDPDAQIQLAESMLRDNPRNLNHWLLCSTKHDLYSKL